MYGVLVFMSLCILCVSFFFFYITQTWKTNKPDLIGLIFYYSIYNKTPQLANTAVLKSAISLHNLTVTIKLFPAWVHWHICHCYSYIAAKRHWQTDTNSWVTHQKWKGKATRQCTQRECMLFCQMRDWAFGSKPSPYANNISQGSVKLVNAGTVYLTEKKHNAHYSSLCVENLPDWAIRGNLAVLGK